MNLKTIIALSLQGVSKSFSGTLAVRDASIDVARGEVRAVVGENGAGKSTLMGIAAGVFVPDTGAVEVNGIPVRHPTPARMRDLGVAVVYQHPALAADLSIAENMLLAVPPGRRPSRRRANHWVREQLEMSNLALDPAQRVANLNVGQRHLVEIAKAFATNASVMIFDEPTEPLSAAEAERLFEQIGRAAERGVAVLYISHRLREVERIADRVTVLRDGTCQGTFDVDALSEAAILDLIVGRPVASAFPPKGERDERRVRLRVDQCSSEHFAELDLSFFAGEVVGLAGIDGNGQREFLRALAGIVPFTGDVRVDGHAVESANPSSAIRGGLTYVPADRRSEGLIMPLSVRENMTLATLPDYARAGVMRRDREQAIVAEQTQSFQIKAASPEWPVASLSGGNQQKVLVARAMLTHPKVLLADEPTRSVDAVARLEILRHIRAAAQRGASVILLSSDALELEGLCDRVLVFSRGHVIAELRGSDVTESNIAHALVTASNVRARGDASLGLRHRIISTQLGDYAPSLLLAALIAAVACFTTLRNDKYLSPGNIESFLFLLSSLGFVALAQSTVILAGAIDLSVGSLTSFSIVLASLLLRGGPTETVTGVAILLGAAACAGFGNGFLVSRLGLTPIIATLVSFFALQGIALILRPTPGGTISGPLADALGTTIGFVPVSFIVLVGSVVGLEILLRSSRWGLALRATGSDPLAARRLGINIAATQLGAYLVCALLTCVGALLLGVQIGVGDAHAGVSYTLSSIAAVILGGTSITGGRGSFVGALLGATILQQLSNVTTFIGLNSAWQYWLVGALTLLAATAYSKAPHRTP